MSSEKAQTDSPPVIDLSKAPGAGEAWGGSKTRVYAWALCELLFVTNPIQISSRLRIAVLRSFGANIGKGVTFRPRTRVKFPWNLSVGDRSWIGEGVWIHNQDQMVIGSDVVLSQETFLTNGSHAHRRDMALLTRPVTVGDGSWITTRCIVLGGSNIGASCVTTPGSILSGSYAANSVIGSAPAAVIGERFKTDPR